MDANLDAELSAANSSPLFDLFGNAGVHPILVSLSAIRLMTGIFGIISNLALIYITIKTKNLQGTCNLFIAAESLFGLLAVSSFCFSFVLAITGVNFIPLGQCAPIMAYAAFANIMWKLALFLVSLDRLLIVSFPLVFGQKPLMFFGISIGVASAYSGFVVFLTWSAINEPDRFVKPVTCIVADLSDVGSIGNFSLANSIGIVALAIFNYALLGAILKCKSDKSEQEKHTRQYTRQIFKMLLFTAALSILGWMLNPAIRLILQNLELTALQNLCFSVVLSCLTNLAMFFSPFLLYAFSKDYKEAFRKCFPLIFHSQTPKFTTKVVTIQTQKTQRPLTSQINTSRSEMENIRLN